MRNLFAPVTFLASLGAIYATVTGWDFSGHRLEVVAVASIVAIGAALDLMPIPK